jgi:hypothetical protein
MLPAAIFKDVSPLLVKKIQAHQGNQHNVRVIFPVARRLIEGLYRRISDDKRQNEEEQEEGISLIKIFLDFHTAF